MALSTADFRLVDRAVYFGAKGAYLNPAPEFQEWTVDFGLKQHVWTGIRQQDVRNGAGLAQVGRPVMRRGHFSDQATFFFLATSKIVAIKIFTFSPGWCFHLYFFNLTQ